VPAESVKIEFEGICDNDTYVDESGVDERSVSVEPGNECLARGRRKSLTPKGYVIDSACNFKNHLKKPLSAECAEKCSRAALWGGLRFQLRLS